MVTVFRSPLYLQSNRNLREVLDRSCLLLHLLEEFALDLLVLEVAMLDGTRFLPKAEEDSGCWMNLGRFQFEFERSDLIARHLNDLGFLTNLKKIAKNLNTNFNRSLGYPKILTLHSTQIKKASVYISRV